MGIRIVTAVFACLVALNGTAQQEDYIQPGLIKSSLTISPSWMLNKPEANYYLTGFLEGYLTKHVSWRGETNYFIDGRDENPFYKFNSQTSFGVLAHVNKNNLDAHVGFMPGLSINQVNGDVNAQGKNHFTPTFSINAGATYYMWKFFHVFANATYIHATINGLDREAGLDGRADEFMISAGLGFNLNLIRKE